MKNHPPRIINYDIKQVTVISQASQESLQTLASLKLNSPKDGLTTNPRPPYKHGKSIHKNKLEVRITRQANNLGPRVNLVRTSLDVV
ncbi:hypothetical protein GIB67_028794 [Kingdonia uniflora]|uniref:Uncharacterized protein n=1 Tax=Kingdonia uniflora TaxID=39325 RepID=A0A7J7LWZ2_9MAGN|nr:hypothetical protein GIB67_028794 [Kingdonia uniflora]